MKTVVYTQPGCGECMFVMKWLESRDVEYEAINIRENDEALEKVQSSGYSSLPVVEIDGEIVFNRFNEDKLEEYFG